MIELGTATRVVMRYVAGTGAEVLRGFAPGTRILHVTEGHSSATGNPFLLVWLLVPGAS